MSDTLDNLMKVHPPGTRFEHNQYGYFQCFFKDGSDLWVGKDLSEDVLKFMGNREVWSLWQEPKKKVKKWLWACRASATGEWKPSSIFYSDKEAQEKYGHLYVYAYQKVLGSEIEVDE